MDQVVNFDLQRCTSAFKQGKYNEAVKFLPQLQQPAVLRQAATTEFKTPINDAPSRNVSLLHLAAYHGWIEIIRTLIPSAPLTLYKDSHNQTYLHYAALGGKFEMLVYLITNKVCDPRTRGHEDMSLLHYASSGGNTDIIRYIIREQPCGQIVYCGYLPLHIACLSGHLNVVKYFITDQKCVLTNQGPKNNTPLHYASIGGHLDIIDYLITVEKCDCMTENVDGILPLHYACRKGHLNVVKYFIGNQKCDLTSRDEFCSTSLCHARLGGHMNIIQYLQECKLRFACINGLLDKIKHFINKKSCDPKCKDQDGKTLLHYASENGDMNIIRFLITEKHCDSKTTTSGGVLPLHIACLHGHFNLVNYFITEQHCNPTSQTVDGDTPLHYASIGGHEDIVKYLISKGHCHPSTSNNKGLLPIHTACLNGHWKVVKFYLMSTETGRIRGSNGDTLFHYASEGGHENILRNLTILNCFKRGTSTNCNSSTSNSKGLLPLHSACIHGHLNVVKFYFEFFVHNFGRTSRGPNGDTILHYASENGHVDIVKYVIEHQHCNHKSFNNMGILPVHVACLHGHLNVVKYFVTEQSCDLTIRDDDGKTMLHYASKGGHLNIIEYLVEKTQCDPTTADNLPLHSTCDPTILNDSFHLACANGHLNVVKFFINKQILDPSKVLDKDGRTVLHTACYFRHTHIMEWLLHQGRDDTSQEPNGDTILHYASKSGHVDIVKYVIKHQHCNAKSSNNMGVLPVHVACLHGHLNVVKYFVTNLSCDLTIQDNDGKTMLHYASEGGHLNIIEYIVEKTQCDQMTADNLPLHSTCDPTILNDSFHLACANGHLNVVKFFINKQFLDPSKVFDKDGRTVLHTACYFRHTHIVEWLLHEGRVDIMAKDNKRRTCIDLATNCACYPLLKLFKPLVDSKKSFPIHSYSKVVLTGNGGAGKTTLAKVISERAILKTYLYHLFSRDRLVDQVELCTAGIIPSYINSREVGNIVLYDLAGHAEYLSSHSAIMERVMQQSPATFITVIDFSNKITEIKQQLHYWLNFIDCITSKTAVGSCTLIVVGSHADLCSKEEIQEKSTLVKECIQQGRVQRQQFIDIVTIDCRRIVAVDQFIKLLNNCQQIIADRTPSMSYYCHLLYAFLKNKKWTFCSFHNIFSIFSKEDLSITPDQLTEHLDTLSDRGMIIFLKNQHYLDKSWIVVDTEALLKTIGILFAPKTFTEHHPEIINGSIGPGIIHSSNLKNLFAGYDLDMLVGFLEILELCHCVTNTCEATVNLQNIEDLSSPDLENIHLFIPSLLDNKRPTISSNNDEGFSFGWCLCCKDKEYYFFGNRFLHVLLLRLAYTFKLHHKHVWMDGISWDNEEGYRIVVELVDHKRCVMVVMSHMTRSRKVKLIKCRSKVIRLILDLQQEFCPHMETAEYLISPSMLKEWPTDNVHFPDDSALLSIVNVAKSMLKKSPYILNLAGTSEEFHSTEQVLLDEPYHLMRTSTVCNLMDNSKKTKLISSPSVLCEVNIACQLDQSDLSPTCHLRMRECVDRLSIFAGRDPISIAELDRNELLQKALQGSNRPDVTLMALHNMMKTDGQTDGEPVEIIQRIAAGNYQVFGMYLLNDENMTKVKIIKKNHVHEGAEAITQAIMQKWLEVSEPTSPHTYEHLIECLKQSGLGALAGDIVDALGGVPEGTS